MDQALRSLEALSRGGFSLSDVYTVILIVFVLFVGFLIARGWLERIWNRLADKIFLLKAFRKYQAPLHR
jgi:hypothetical protein